MNRQSIAVPPTSDAVTGGDKNMPRGRSPRHGGRSARFALLFAALALILLAGAPVASSLTSSDANTCYWQSDWVYDPGCDCWVDNGYWVCDPDPVYGCTDPNASNYNPSATVDDGSCQYPPPPVYGCTDPNATNYNPNATVNDGSCTYPPPPPPQTTTVLVNGSFVSPPVPWMEPGNPDQEFEAIAATYGKSPVQSYWRPDSAIFPPYYSDIDAGGPPLANFLASLPGNVNVVAHSHGGNVAIWSTHLMNRPLRHMINLATPVNWDIPRYLGGARAYSRCLASSSSDWVQFAGASPYQIVNFAYAVYQSMADAYRAFQALANGDYATALAYFDFAVFDAIDADNWWYSTKIEVEGATVMFNGLSHGDMHEPPVWNAIAPYCAVN